MGDRGNNGDWLRGVLPGPSGQVRVHLSVDIGVDLPVEVEEVAGADFRAMLALVDLREGDVPGIFGYVHPEMLGISPSLAQDLRAFQRWWEENADILGESDEEFDDDEDEDDPEWLRWEAEGRELVVRLQAELGPRYDVRWDGHSSD